MNGGRLGDDGRGSSESRCNRGCLNLEELDMKRCINLGDRGIIALATRCLGGCAWLCG